MKEFNAIHVKTIQFKQMLTVLQDFFLLAYNKHAKPKLYRISVNVFPLKNIIYIDKDDNRFSITDY